jgi:hypothetical protein
MSAAPVTVVVRGDRLIIDAPSGFGRASLLGALDVPISHVDSVRQVDRPQVAVSGWREGIGLPHLRMGTWRHDGVKDYVAIRTDMAGLVIELRDEPYARVIVSVDDPSGIATALGYPD